MPEYKFTINVWIQDKPDPAAAIEWFMDHLTLSMQIGELFIRGLGPDGEQYLWRPERGKSPEQWLVNSWPPDHQAAEDDETTKPTCEGMGDPTDD
jgi:hypothetical protein